MWRKKRNPLTNPKLATYIDNVIEQKTQKLTDEFKTKISQLVTDKVSEKTDEQFQEIKSKVDEDFKVFKNTLGSEKGHIRTSVEEKLAKSQRDYIAILGIFASIVLAAANAFAITNKTLEIAPDDFKSPQFFLLVLLAAFCMVNVVFGLLFFVWHILRLDYKRVTLKSADAEKSDAIVTLVQSPIDNPVLKTPFILI